MSNEIVPKKMGGAVQSPESKGRMKRGPLDWSLDELIAYKATGGSPARIPDADLLYKLGSIGVSMDNAAGLFEISREKFCSNLDWLENWQRGRAECGARIRSKIVDQALIDNVLNAQIYLDKLLGGDKITEQVQVEVRNTTLQQYDTIDLLDVLIKSNDESSDNQR